MPLCFFFSKVRLISHLGQSVENLVPLWTQRFCIRRYQSSFVGICIDRSGNSAEINSASSFLLEPNPHQELTSGFIFVSFNSAIRWLNEMAYNSLL